MLARSCHEAESPAMSTLPRQKLTMIYWKSDKFWLGRLRDFPDLMTQGRTLTELEENMRDAYQMMNPDLAAANVVACLDFARELPDFGMASG